MFSSGGGELLGGVLIGSLLESPSVVVGKARVTGDEGVLKEEGSPMLIE